MYSFIEGLGSALIPLHSRASWCLGAWESGKDCQTQPRMISSMALPGLVHTYTSSYSESILKEFFVEPSIYCDWLFGLETAWWPSQTFCSYGGRTPVH